LKISLVTYMYGKGILLVNPIIVMSLSGGIFEKMLWKIYPVVLSQLLHSMVILLAICSVFSVIIFDLHQLIKLWCSEYERYFACTGLLIKWHQRTVVLTSASLVRKCNDKDIYEDEIDKNLKVDALNHFSWYFKLCVSQLS
jgi:hypothetical protein